MAKTKISLFITTKSFSLKHNLNICGEKILSRDIFCSSYLSNMNRKKMQKNTNKHIYIVFVSKTFPLIFHTKKHTKTYRYIYKNFIIVSRFKHKTSFAIYSISNKSCLLSNNEIIYSYS